MPHVIRMPKLGMEMQEGELLEWHVGVDDRVEEGDAVAEIESEKTVTVVTAREDGTIRRLLIDEGTTVEPGTPIAIVAEPSAPIDGVLDDLALPGGNGERSDDGSGEPSAGDGSPPSPAEPSSGEQPGEGHPAEAAGAGAPAGRASPRARRRARELGVDIDGIEATGPDGAVVERDVERAAGRGAGSGTATDGVKATPKARTRGRELGVDPATVEGTGPGGAVTAADVDAAVTATGVDAAAGGSEATPGTDHRDTAAPATQQPSGRPSRTVTKERELSGMRRTIADRLGESYRNAAHVTVGRDVDVGALLEVTDAADAAFEVDVSLQDVLLLALSATLSDHPSFNATFEEGVHRTYDEQHVGVAVDVEDGLVAPVLRNVERKGLAALARERRALVERTLDGEFTMDDLASGTFTVTNLGMFDVDSFTPIINPPQVAILGVNRVRDAPVPDGDGGVAFEPRLYLDLSFDHRVVDGADAARFLGTFADYAANPWPLVLDEGRHEQS